MEVIMASLYKKNNVYYLSVKLNGIRRAKSLHTEVLSAAKKLRPLVEFELLKELHGLKTKDNNIAFKDLILLYLKADQDWSEKTREHSNYVLKSWIKNNGKIPDNRASADTFKRRINAVLNWGQRQNYKCIDLVKYKLSSPPARLRVFTLEECKIIINHFEPIEFRRFCEFAYNTGGRSGEIRKVKIGNFKEGNLFVKGKTGYRTIVLNKRAKELLDWFDYSKEYVSHRFKKECRRHCIKDARFHDLRRTFGYRLILNGMPIYHVSKLLGHSSVTTTERHYAPLMATEIEEFIL